MGAQIERRRLRPIGGLLVLSLGSVLASLTPPGSSLKAPLAPQTAAALSPAAKIGQKIFFDASLSASGKISCATCHDPDYAYAPANGLAVQFGGKDLTDAGTRAVPSLCYKEYTPAYNDILENPDGISAPGPGGGFTQDGRAPTLADQAEIPLLAPNEMANTSPADVVSKLRKAEYAELFRAAFGSGVFDDVQQAFKIALAAQQIRSVCEQ
jgi:cytochrome c peroxidase